MYSNQSICNLLLPLVMHCTFKMDFKHQLQSDAVTSEVIVNRPSSWKWVIAICKCNISPEESREKKRTDSMEFTVFYSWISQFNTNILAFRFAKVLRWIQTSHTDTHKQTHAHTQRERGSVVRLPVWYLRLAALSSSSSSSSPDAHMKRTVTQGRWRMNELCNLAHNFRFLPLSPLFTVFSPPLLSAPEATTDRHYGFTAIAVPLWVIRSTFHCGCSFASWVHMMASIGEFDPLNTRVPATKIEVTVSCR